MFGLGDWIVAVDPEGHVVWYVAVPGGIHQVARAADGELLAVVSRQGVVKFDLSGVPSALYRAETFDEPADAIEVGAAALHHDVIELPNGDLAGLSS